jgi:GT2 family glycosyltransferase
MRPPRLSVLLETYRQPEILKLTLQDLNAQKYPSDSWELVLLDDGGRDHSIERAMEILDQDITLITKRLPNGGNYEHSKLFNEMLRLANLDSEVFVHVEDVRIREDFLTQHAKWHSGSRLYLVTGPVCEGEVKNFEHELDGRWNLMKMSGVISQSYQCCFQAIFAKSMSYSAKLVDKLLKADGEVFDSHMSGWGYQETEFALRAEQAGATCVYDVSVAVHHPLHKSQVELIRRKLDREQILSSGKEKNIRYLCKKHGMTKLPDWKVGVPIETLQVDFGW